MYLFFRDICRQRLIAKLAIILICTGCARENHITNQTFFEPQYISSLPAQLRGEGVQFKQLLNAYDNLNEQQRAAALEHFIGQKYLIPEEQAQAAYMLARLYKKNIETEKNKKSLGDLKAECRQAIALFDLAKSNRALRRLSLWHIIEVATISGDEKLVRQIFNEMLAQKTEPADQAAIQYGLAQSYLRTFENERAIAILEKIRLDFPHTDYALGAGYYLGTLEYAQLEANYKAANIATQASLKQQAAAAYKKVVAYYIDYLQGSTNGRFAQDILAKLSSIENKYNWHFNENELATIAKAYFANNAYVLAVAYWQRANAQKHAYEIADCLLKLGKTDAAIQYLFSGLEKYPHDTGYFSIATQISDRLSKAESLQLWGKLHNNKYVCQDQVLWNLAIREPLAQALVAYQNLLKRYPTSIYAPEAQWRLFWQKYKATKGHALLSVAELSIGAANKYSESKLVPRFLYWTAKIFHTLGNKEQALLYFEKTVNRFPLDYYGQRSRVQIASIQGRGADNYFILQMPLLTQSQKWDWPYPENALEQLKFKQQDTLYTLAQLKQFDEAFAISNDAAPAEIVSWLLAKNAQPLLAINTSVKQIEAEKRSNRISLPSIKEVKWQYAYPLLYNQQISIGCQGSSITDPILVQALIREESRYNPYAISVSKALGLCQLMPGTASGVAKGLGVQIKSNDDLFQPDLNIKLGTRYLSGVLQALQGNSLLAVAAYNAGINAVKNKIADKEKFVVNDPDFFVEDFPYRETRDYVRKVFSSYWIYREIYSGN